MNSLHDEFYRQQYLFLQNNGYDSYFVKSADYKNKFSWKKTYEGQEHINNHGQIVICALKTEPVATKILNHPFLKKENFTTDIHKVENSDSFIKNFFYYGQTYTTPLNLSGKNVTTDYLTYFYKNNPHLGSEILKNFYDVYGSISPSYQIFLDNIPTEDLIKTIHKFPISVWRLQDWDLKELGTYLENRVQSKEEMDSFWFKFLKNRKNQIKDPDFKMGPEVRDFLLNYYNENRTQLEPYFPICSYLEAHFVTPDIDPFEYTADISTTVKLNCHKLKELFMFDNWSAYTYALNIEILFNNMVSHYQLEEVIVKETESTSGILMVNFLHNNQSFGKDTITSNVFDFLNYIKTNQDFNINSDACQTWLMHRKLASIIPVKTNKMKKNKI